MNCFSGVRGWSHVKNNTGYARNAMDILCTWIVINLAGITSVYIVDIWFQYTTNILRIYHKLQCHQLIVYTYTNGSLKTVRESDMSNQITGCRGEY
jgi:hypothetical protein